MESGYISGEELSRVEKSHSALDVVENVDVDCGLHTALLATGSFCSLLFVRHPVACGVWWEGLCYTSTTYMGRSQSVSQSVSQPFLKNKKNRKSNRK